MCLMSKADMSDCKKLILCLMSKADVSDCKKLILCLMSKADVIYCKADMFNDKSCRVWMLKAYYVFNVKNWCVLMLKADVFYCKKQCVLL